MTKKRTTRKTKSKKQHGNFPPLLALLPWLAGAASVAGVAGGVSQAVRNARAIKSGKI